MHRAGILILCLAASVAVAIPIEVSEPGFSLTLPEGFREVTDASQTSDITRLFVLTPEDTGGGAATWLTISRVKTNRPAALEEAGDTNGMKVIGRYSERMNNLDVEVLVSQVHSNDAMSIEQSARLPLDPNAIQLDLKVHSDDDQKARETMRKIIQSVARTAPPAQPPEASGWGAALLCLVMVAVVFVVILARR
jgi:hypothetical protein